MYIYQFRKDFGRMGFIDGLFLARPADIEKIMGKTIYFGEALGKHSEIECEINETNIELKCDDKALVDRIFLSFNHSLTLCGYNPLDYYDEDL